MPASRLVPSGGPAIRSTSGGHEIEQIAERTFQLTHPQVDLLKKSTLYQLQVRLAKEAGLWITGYVLTRDMIGAARSFILTLREMSWPIGHSSPLGALYCKNFEKMI